MLVEVHGAILAPIVFYGTASVVDASHTATKGGKTLEQSSWRTHLAVAGSYHTPAKSGIAFQRAHDDQHDVAV